MNKLIRNCCAFLIAFVTILGLNCCYFTANASGEGQIIHATVTEIEKYGHAVLNFTAAEFTGNGFALGDIVCVRFDSYASDMPFYDGYYTNPGEVMLRGLSAEDGIALCINYGDFSKETGIAPGDTVEITLIEKAGMLAYQELCALQYSDNRADYSSDAEFANFRAVTAGRISNGKLYRSASPINNERGRARYANAFIADAGVASVLNLADSIEDIEEYCSADDFESEYYRTLYENGKVKALDLNADFFSDEFAASLADGLCFLAQNDPPYSVHCTEGKDRAGFTIMLVEALMGADLQTIIDDYMLSFYNYYGIEQKNEPERYEAVLNNNLFAMLYHVTGVNTYEELTQVDLECAVTQFLLNAGMAEDDILTLKTKLT